MSKFKCLAGLLTLGFSPLYAQSLINFNAKSIIAISDADMAASAFVDGKLLRDNASKDQLTTIKFPIQRGSAGVSSTLISNSAVGYGKAMAIPLTNGLGYVLETRMRPEDGVVAFKDVVEETPPGEKIFAVDLLNLSAPKAKFGFAVGKNPVAVDVNKNELIIATSGKGKELVFFEAEADGKPTNFLNLPAAIDSSEYISDLSWHPSGDFIAFTLANSNEVGLYRVMRIAGKMKNVEMVGKPIKVGVDPSYGRFSPDGKHYFVLDTKGEKGKAKANSEIFVVDFSMDGAIEHKIAGKAEAGLNSGAFAISPDGKLLVAVNAGNSAAPWTDASAGKGASLTLFNVGAKGVLTKVADYPVMGIAPQSVVFDKDGSNIAVSVAEYLEFGNGTGGVEFWTVNKGAAPSLKKQEGKVAVAKGVHTLRIIP